MTDNNNTPPTSSNQASGPAKPKNENHFDPRKIVTNASTGEKGRGAEKQNLKAQPIRVEDAKQKISSRPASIEPSPKSNGQMQEGPTVIEGDGGLSAEGIAKSFKRRPVVRNVSMRVNRGEAVGLLGPNGAGKTTCFYMITGLIPADQGAIRIDGTDVTRLPMYQRARLGIGYLPQEASIFRGLTVEQNLKAVVELVEKDRDRQEALVNELLSEFSITHIRNASALALSGGERRRVEIARALATGPAYMLLDEPFAGIDPLAIADIRDLVSHLKTRGIGVLITDHNVRETLDIIDRAYIIHEGEVLIEGTPSEIVGDEDVRRVYLGDGFQM